MGSVFFSLTITPFKSWFLYVESYYACQKLIFDDKDTNILRMCVHLLFIEHLNSTVFQGFIFWRFLFMTKCQIKILAKYMFYSK